MSSQSYQQVLISAQADGTAKTATAIASILHPSSIYTLPPNFIDVIGKTLRITAMGRISCVVTTPGTCRFDIMLAGVSVFNTGALNLNIVAKTNVPWWFTMDLVCRSIGNGTNATLFGIGEFTSEAVVGAAANTAGGNGTLLCPVGAPAVGAGFNSTIANTVDLQHTQTVSTGSIQVHMFSLEALN